MPDIILIGERINSTNKRVRHILETRNEGELLRLARDQVAGGAAYIDINASMLMKDEMPALGWAAGCIASSVDAGVSIDSPSVDILLDVVPELRGSVILNSFTCDDGALERAVAAVTQYGASVIIMLKSGEGIPETIEGRMRLARRVATAIRAAGVSPSLIYIDPVFSPIATSPGGMAVVLGTLAALAAEYPEYHRIGGLSNVSYGLPRRRAINRAFLAMAVSHGLDAAICDTTDAALTEAVTVSEMLIGRDPGCRRFLQSYRRKKSR